MKSLPRPRTTLAWLTKSVKVVSDRFTMQNSEERFVARSHCIVNGLWLMNLSFHLNPAAVAL